MAKPPHLYQKIIASLARFEQEQEIRRELRRRRIVAELCRNFRLTAQDVKEALRELEEMKQLERINQRKFRLK